MKCKKCDSLATVVLRRKDEYCENCFIISVNHKLRALLGKKKSLRANEKVLLCHSGGAGSTVLLDLINNGITLDSHKRLRIVPLILHIADDQDGNDITNIITATQKYGLDIFIVNITDYDKVIIDLPCPNTIPKKDEDALQKFKMMLASMSSTSINDLLLKIKRKIFIQYAKLLDCSIIFTAETTSTLAVNLLSNIALGRGSQVESNIGFIDNRDEDVTILKPMKDISQEELTYYIDIQKLKCTKAENVKQNSLQSVIGSFVLDLQNNFPATISTVCKTADKLGQKSEGTCGSKCKMCNSYYDISSNTLTAMDAINFSKAISLNMSEDVLLLEQVSQTQLLNKKNSCYSCSRNHYETR